MGTALLDAVAAAAIVAPPAIGSWSLRRRLLPDWSAAPARLAEMVLTLAAVLAVSQLLGVIGVLRRVPLAVGCVAIGAAMVTFGRRAPATPPVPTRPIDQRGPTSPRGRLVGGVLAVFVVALVAGMWATNVRAASIKGVLDSDSLHYHLPHAARFVHDGSITQLDVTMYDPMTSFWPENGELVTADAMIATKSDVLVPYVSFAWLALALLAGWCIGDSAGFGLLGLLGAALAMGSPLMVAEAGTARVDTALVALTLGCAAIVLRSGWRPTAIFVAGLAAGMAAGTKVTALPLLGALTIALVVAAPRPSRRAVTVSWVASLASLSIVWYIRDWWRTGNPIPTIHAAIGPLKLPSPPFVIMKRYPTPVGPYLFERGVLEKIPPQLHDIFGFFWPVLIVLAVAGLAVTATRSSDRLVQALGIAGLVGLVAYFFTPLTVFGNPLVIRHGIRFSMFVPALGLVLLPLLPIRRRQPIALAAVEIAVLAGMVLRQEISSAAFALTALATVSAALIVLAVVRLAISPILAGAGAAVIFIAALAGLCDRPLAPYAFPDLPPPDGPGVAAVWQWAAHQHHQRIGYIRFVSPYPLYGRDLSNTPIDVGQHGPHGAFGPFATCNTYRHALADGHFHYIVVGPYDASRDEIPTTVQGPEAQWTRTIPGVREFISNGPYSVFDLTGATLNTPCPS